MVSRALALASFVAALAALPLAATSARAQESAPAPVDGTVSLRLAGPDDPALRDSIRELLARLHLAVSGPEPDADGGARATVARVEIDLSSPTDALLLVTDPSGEVRFRRSVPRDASAAIVREEIAHAVQSAVESSLLAARERAAQPPPAPAPPPVLAPVVVAPPPIASVKEQPTASARPSPFGLEITTLAGVGPIADGSGPATRIGLGAGVISRGVLHPSIGLSALYAVPFDSGTVELSSHTSIVSVRALPAIELVHGKWLAVDLGVGAGFDVTTVSPHSSNLPPTNLNNPTTFVDPILSAMLTAHAGLVPGVVVLLSAGVDFDPYSRQYVLAQGSADTEVLSSWRVRPMILAGFGFTALGDGHFAATGGR